MKTIIPLVIITAAAIGAIAVQDQPSQAEPAPLTQEQFDGAKIQVLAKKVKALEEELAATQKKVAEIKSCECEPVVKKSLATEPKQTAPKQTAPVVTKTAAPAGWTCGPNGCSYTGTRYTTQRRGLFGRRR